MNTDTDRAAEVAAGLRELAAMFSDHPHLAADVRPGSSHHIYISGLRDGDVRGRIVAFARAGLACGAQVTEHNSDKFAGVDVVFGPVGLHVYGDADQVIGVTRRTVEQVDGGTCRITEYTSRPILADLDTQPVVA